MGRGGGGGEVVGWAANIIFYSPNFSLIFYKSMAKEL